MIISLTSIQRKMVLASLVSLNNEVLTGEVQLNDRVRKWYNLLPKLTDDDRLEVDPASFASTPNACAPSQAFVDRIMQNDSFELSEVESFCEYLEQHGFPSPN